MSNNNFQNLQYQSNSENNKAYYNIYPSSIKNNNLETGNDIYYVDNNSNEYKPQKDSGGIDTIISYVDYVEKNAET